MFSSSDYKELVSSGIDIGIMTLVESAYRVLFEGDSGNSVRPVPFRYDDAARFLGIDTTDCEGSNATASIARKLNSDPRFMQVDRLVNSSMDMAMDELGLRYRDEGGEPVWVYQDVKNSANFRNVEENLKNALKLAILKDLSSSCSDNESFAAGLNKIDRVALADEIQMLFDRNSLIEKLTKNNNRFEKTISEDTENFTTSGIADNAVRESKGGMAWEAANMQILLRNEDGTEWVKEEGDRILAFLVPGSGISIMRLDLRGEEGAYRIQDIDFMNNQAISHRVAEDFVNFLTADFCLGLCRDTPHNDDLSMLQAKLTWDDRVRILKKSMSTPDTYISHLWNDIYRGTVYFGRFNELQFLAACVDRGLVDSDDLSEWVEMAVKEESVVVVHDPEIMSIAKRYGLYARYPDNEQHDYTIELPILRPWDDPNDLIKALTGTPGHATIRVADFMKMLEIADDDDSLSDKFSPKMLREPNVQMAIFRVRGIHVLMCVLGDAIGFSGQYIPLSEDVVEYALNDSGTRAIENCLRLMNYFDGLLRSHSMNAASRDTLFSDIKKFMTPRVQQTLLHAVDNDSAKRCLLKFGTVVPGFRVFSSELYGTTVGGDENDINKYRDSVTGNMLLRRIREYLSFYPDNTEQAFGLFIKLCLGRSVVKEVESNSPLGKRILSTFLKLNEPQSGGWMFDALRYSVLLHGLVTDDLTTYFRTYIKPLKRNFSFSTSRVRDNTYYVVEYLMQVLDSYMHLYESDSGLAREIFLDGKRGGIISCNEQMLVDNGAGSKKMAMRNDVLARCIIAYALWELWACHEKEYDEEPKSFNDAVATILAGQHLALSVDDSEWKSFGLRGDKVTKALFDISAGYDKDLPEGAPAVISTEDIEKLMKDKPTVLLSCINMLPDNIAHEVCKKCFTPETVQNMSTTPEGLELLLRLAAMGGWDEFTTQFVRAHEIKINSVIENMPSEEAERVKQMLAPYFSKGGEFSANAGSMASAELGKKVEYHEANGLLWMTGYYDGATGVKSSRNVMLYSKEDAEAIMAQLGSTGWRLPTVTELNNLGQDTGAIASKQLGFSPTGKADADGSMSPNSEYVCYAWCVDADMNMCGYSVDNNVIDTDADDIEDGDMLAIKLVR